MSQRADARLERLERWLQELFSARDFTIAPASADASFRRYFRVTRAGGTLIAMDAPPDKEDMQPYIRIAAMLVEVGVNAPRVLEQNLREGFLLNSDLGSLTYLTELDRGGDSRRLYGDAIASLVRIQAGGRKFASQLPAYDDALLRREMALFPEWFCGKHLGLQFTAADQAGLNAVFDALVAEALAQPRVFVHRDYHSRNLMVTDGALGGSNPGILDFQDAVHGPITYDLVSLLRDCYIAWPLEQVHAWVLDFRKAASEERLNVGTDERQFLRWFDFMGVQRHLKAIGIFARLWHRDGKPGYLKDIPRTLNYVRSVSARYPELRLLGNLIESDVLPRLAEVPAVQA